MSSDEKPRNAVHLLRAFHRTTRALTSEEHGSPMVTALSRLLVLVMGLGLGGPFFWGVIRTMPPALALLIGSAVIFRVVRWFYRRG